MPEPGIVLFFSAVIGVPAGVAAGLGMMAGVFRLPQMLVPGFLMTLTPILIVAAWTLIISFTMRGDLEGPAGGMFVIVAILATLLFVFVAQLAIAASAVAWLLGDGLRRRLYRTTAPSSSR
jgi:hypothetical protein